MRSMTTVPRMPQFDRREASEDADEGPGTKRAVWPVIVTAEGVEGAGQQRRQQAAGASYDSWENGGVQG